MAVPPVVGIGAIRLSLGRTTTEAEIDEVLHRLDALPDDRDQRST
jgi:cysteine sulfinate desulfinase/cysteine desulfurase-like protein